MVALGSVQGCALACRRATPSLLEPHHRGRENAGAIPVASSAKVGASFAVAGGYARELNFQESINSAQTGYQPGRYPREESGILDLQPVSRRP